MATPRLGLVVEDKPTELSCSICNVCMCLICVCMYAFVCLHETINLCTSTCRHLSTCLLHEYVHVGVPEQARFRISSFMCVCM